MPESQNQRNGEVTYDVPPRKLGWLDPQVLWEEALNIGRSGPRRRALPAVPTATAHAWTKAVEREILPHLIGDHRVRHRRHHRSDCGPLCETRDAYAYLLITMRLARELYNPSLPVRTTPVKIICIPAVVRVCRLTIKNPASFHLAVSRDLSALKAALATPKLRRTKAQAKLIWRYNMTAASLEHLAARDPSMLQI